MNPHADRLRAENQRLRATVWFVGFIAFALGVVFTAVAFAVIGP